MIQDSGKSIGIMARVFHHSGKKIKIISQVFFWIFVVASFVMGIVVMSEIREIGGWLGIAIWIFGPLVAWLSFIVLYGFGELIEHAASIDEKMVQPLSDKKTEKKSTAYTEKLEKKEKKKSGAYLERLNTLETLRSQGLITEEEYRQAVSKEV